MESDSFLPFTSATTLLPGPRSRVLANPSETTTSLAAPRSGARPRRITSRSIRGSALSGKPIIRPTTGSATPGTSSVTSNTTVVSASLTPGIAAMRRSTSRGARLMSANTCAKRADS